MNLALSLALVPPPALVPTPVQAPVPTPVLDHVLKPTPESDGEVVTEDDEILCLSVQEPTFHQEKNCS